MDYNKLEHDICNAEISARDFAAVDDGGTCNFDTPIVNLGKGVNKKKLAEMDWRIEPVSERGNGGWYFVFIDLRGQANRRTKMAEAAAKSLQESGWEASVWYQMD